MLRVAFVAFVAFSMNKYPLQYANFMYRDCKYMLYRPQI